MLAARILWPEKFGVVVKRQDPFAVLSGKHILVVEDCEEVAAIIRDAFTSCGSIVQIARSGEQSLWPLARQSIDLVTLDFALPGRNGWEVLEFIRSAAPGLVKRTLFLTGRRYDDVALVALRRGGIPYLFKPFGIDDLRGTACSLLRPPRSAMVA